EPVDLAGLRQRVHLDLARLRQLLFDDLVAQVDALVADVHAGTRDELLDLLLTLPAEGALEQIATVTNPCHVRRSLLSRSPAIVPVHRHRTGPPPMAAPPADRAPGPEARGPGGGTPIIDYRRYPLRAPPGRIPPSACRRTGPGRRTGSLLRGEL